MHKTDILWVGTSQFPGVIIWQLFSISIGFVSKVGGKWKWSNGEEKWNEHNLMYIYHKQCEIMQKMKQLSCNWRPEFQWIEFIFAPGFCQFLQGGAGRASLPFMTIISFKCRTTSTGLEDQSHPMGRKSSTGMSMSLLRQLGELLDKTFDIVPGNRCCY